LQSLRQGVGLQNLLGPCEESVASELFSRY
jgi:hypothetical protein